MSRRKFIVSTTINPPTEAIKRFDAMEDWTLIVAGDLKTSSSYALDRGTYLSPDDQCALGFRLTDVLPWNTLSRRNVATLYALREGADVIAFVDDDNVPHVDWNTRATSHLVCADTPAYARYLLTGQLCVDPLVHTYSDDCFDNIWHRGFPIQLLDGREGRQDLITNDRGAHVVVQAGLWDGEPDIDAICRIANGPFDLKLKFFGGLDALEVAQDVFAPFNTQNTVVTRDAAKCMALLPHVGRMDDIWSSYMVERAMWEHGLSVAYVRPTVTQWRNEHDLLRDLQAEMLGNTHTLKLLDILRSCDVSAGAELVETFEHVAYAVEKSGALSANAADDMTIRFYDAWFDDLCRMDR